MGMLTVYGSIRLAQFWPNGSSDADTCKVKPFRFEYEGSPTTTFDGEDVESRLSRRQRNWIGSVRFA